MGQKSKPRAKTHLKQGNRHDRHNKQTSFLYCFFFFLLLLLLYYFCYYYHFSRSPPLKLYAAYLFGHRATGVMHNKLSVCQTNKHIPFFFFSSFNYIHFAIYSSYALDRIYLYKYFQYITKKIFRNMFFFSCS